MVGTVVMWRGEKSLLRDSECELRLRVDLNDTYHVSVYDDISIFY